MTFIAIAMHWNIFIKEWEWMVVNWLQLNVRE